MATIVSASSLVASVGNRDQWKNNRSAMLNGNAINQRCSNYATARTNEGLWKSQHMYNHSRTQSPSYARSTDGDEGLWPFSYPEPFLRAVRRGALAKSITGYHKNMVRKQCPVLELANQMPFSSPEPFSLGHSLKIRLWFTRPNGKI